MYKCDNEPDDSTLLHLVALLHFVGFFQVASLLSTSLSFAKDKRFFARTTKSENQTKNLALNELQANLQKDHFE